MVPVRVHLEGPIARLRRQAFISLDRWRGRQKKNAAQIVAQHDHIAKLAEAGQQEDFSNDLLDDLKSRSEDALALLLFRRNRLLLEGIILVTAVALLKVGVRVHKRFYQWMSSPVMQRSS